MDDEVWDKFHIDSHDCSEAFSVDSFFVFISKKVCLCESMSMCVCMHRSVNQENRGKEDEGELGEKKVPLNSIAQEREREEEEKEPDNKVTFKANSFYGVPSITRANIVV